MGDAEDGDADMMSLVFLASVPVGESQLVKVMCDGRQLGVLAFTVEQWREILEHGSAEIFLARGPDAT